MQLYTFMQCVLCAVCIHGSAWLRYSRNLQWAHDIFQIWNRCHTLACGRRQLCLQERAMVRGSAWLFLQDVKMYMQLPEACSLN